MDCIRLKRGMIFWRVGDIVPKDNNLFTEKRYPWVIVSADNNHLSHHVTIVPIVRLTKVPKFASNYVDITFHNDHAYIMCDTIQTVNAQSLESSQYDGWLSDEVMRNVSEAIRKSLDVEYTAEDLMSTTVSDQLETVIDHIIEKKLAEARTILPQPEIEDVALKVSETLEELFDISGNDEELSENEGNSSDKSTLPQALDTVVKYAEKDQPKPTRKRNVWTQSAIVEFLHKYDTEDHQKLMKEYNFSSQKSLYQAKHDLSKRLASM